MGRWRLEEELGDELARRVGWRRAREDEELRFERLSDGSVGEKDGRGKEEEGEGGIAWVSLGRRGRRM